jgi:cytidylate kinase
MLMIKVITIDREYGSGAPAIAEKLASQRSWTLWDQNLTCEIAKTAKCDRSAVEGREEKRDSLYYRLLKSYMLGGFEGTLNTSKLEVMDSDTLKQFTQRVVRRVAKEGNCVIVGRGSAYFLQDMPNVFHAFLYATKEEKIRRLHREGKSWSEAANLVQTIDRERSAFIKHYYGKCWPDRYLFNLMVNTSGGEDAAVDIINRAVAAHETHQLAGAILTEDAEKQLQDGTA